MKNLVCEELLLYHPTSTEDENLRSWYIVNFVFNAFLTMTAIIFNSVTIQALRKTSSLSKPLKTLLLSLAVSDLGVGLLVEPLYIGLLVKWLQRDNSTDATCTAFYLIMGLFSGASFVGVVALSVDRFSDFRFFSDSDFLLLCTIYNTYNINSIEEITSLKERKKYNKYITKIKCAQ